MKQIVLGLGLLFALNLAYAQEPSITATDKPTWLKMADVKASFRTESESVTIGTTEEFKSIKLKVNEAPVFIEKVTVFFGSGDTQDIQVSAALKPSSETAVFKVANPSEQIKKVTFTYSRNGNSNDNGPRIEVYGLK